MSVSVVASWSNGLTSQTMYATCDHCHKNFPVVGKGAAGTQGHRLGYTKRSGESAVCDKVFCSRECAKQFIGYR